MKGLVLEGGGARGAYQIGAYKALEEEGYVFDGVCGTSIGALNGALIAQGDAEKAYKLWENLDPAELFGVTPKTWNAVIKKKISTQELPELFKALHGIVREKGIDTKKIKKLLHEVVDEKALRSSTVDFGFITFSLSDRKALEYFKEDVPEGKMVDYIVGSANLPIFQMEKIDGKILLDGGVYDNLPVKLLQKKGYKDLVIIRTFAAGIKKKFERKSFNILWIEPSEDLGNILNFDPENSKFMLKLGYFDVQRLIHSLKGKKYYIKPKNDDTFYLNFFKQFGEQDLEPLANKIGLKGIPPFRLIFEHILPLLSETLGLGQQSSYEDIALGVAEWMAQALSIERFKIYEADELFDTIRKHPKAQKIFHAPKTFPALFIKNELIAKMYKDLVLQTLSHFMVHAYQKPSDHL